MIQLAFSEKVRKRGEEGAIELAPGRVDGIVADLLANDLVDFYCHKTVHGPAGGEWVESEDDESDQHYQPSGKESVCVGSAIYLLKAGRPPVSLRIAIVTGAIRHEDLMAQSADVIDPDDVGNCSGL